jgi:hypothetical protein
MVCAHHLDGRAANSLVSTERHRRLTFNASDSALVNHQVTGRTGNEHDRFTGLTD